MNLRKFSLYLLFVLTSLPGHLWAQRAWDTIPNLPDHYREMVSQFAKEPLVTGKVLFLGNSITEFGNWKKLLKDSSVINRGISGDITFGVLNRLNEIIKHQPSKLFLMIGVNDISKNDNTINIFPNPTTDYIFINSENSAITNSGFLIISDLLGKEIKSISCNEIFNNGMKVSLNAFSNGTYLF